MARVTSHTNLGIKMGLQCASLLGQTTTPIIFANNLFNPHNICIMYATCGGWFFANLWILLRDYQSCRWLLILRGWPNKYPIMHLANSLWLTLRFVNHCWKLASDPSKTTINKKCRSIHVSQELVLLLYCALPRRLTLSWVMHNNGSFFIRGAGIIEKETVRGTRQEDRVDS